MNPTSHRAVALAAVECLAEVETKNGSSKKSFVISGKDISVGKNKKILASADSNTDGYAPECDGETYSKYNFGNEMSFININGAGTLNDNALDDPHKDTSFESSDVCEKDVLGSSAASYNHFIDIGKGKGAFDDYDGYSYHFGSGSVDEYELAATAVPYVTDSFLKNLGNIAAGVYTGTHKTDEAIADFLNDRNVEYPGSTWYSNCSPALWNYSYPPSSSNKYKELANRFPWGGYGSSAGLYNKGKCYPWSVFMPVDNLGRYWYETFLMSRQICDLGPVLHAVQDACVPHHAAGHLGNYHAKYEKYLEGNLHDRNNGKSSWSNAPALRSQAIDLYTRYNHIGSKPKTLTYPQDLTGQEPNLTWSVDQIITWAAFNAYHEYKHTYNSFKDNPTPKITSSQQLFVLSLALSMLILKKAQLDAVDIPLNRKVESIIIESIELSQNQDIMFCINYVNTSTMTGGSIEIGQERDVSISLKKGGNGTVLNVSKYCIDAAHMSLSIKKLSSDTVTIKNLKVSYKTKDEKVHYYYRGSSSSTCILDSRFQCIIPFSVPADMALPLANNAYPASIANQVYVDKLRVYIELGNDKDAGSSGGLDILINNKYLYHQFTKGLTHSTNVQAVVFLLDYKIKLDPQINIQVINKTENAVNITGIKIDLLDGYSREIFPSEKIKTNKWLDPQKQDRITIVYERGSQMIISRPSSQGRPEGGGKDVSIGSGQASRPDQSGNKDSSSGQGRPSGSGRR